MAAPRRGLFTREADALVLAVKAAPKSSRNAILGPMDSPQGPVLKVAVTAPADKGKANAAIMDVIARAFGVSKSAVTVIAGATDRSKILRIAGDPVALSHIAAQWIAP